MKVKLEIELGNEGMQTSDDVAAALEQAAHKMRRREGADLDRPGHLFKIMDFNGNSVGFCRVEE